MSAKCEALVTDGWQSRRCSKSGYHKRLGHLLCTSHQRQFDREEAHGREMVRYTAFWWHWEPTPEPGERRER